MRATPWSRLRLLWHCLIRCHRWTALGLEIGCAECGEGWS